MTMAVLCVYFIAGIVPAFSQTYCADATSAKALQAIGADLDKLQSIVPPLSTQETDAAQKKMMGSLQAIGNFQSTQGMAQVAAMQSALENDPAVQAMMFHGQIKMAKDTLQKLLDNPGQDDDSKVRAIFMVHDYIVKVKEPFHSWAEAKIVTGDSMTNGVALITSLGATTNTYLQCMARQTK